MTSAPDPTAERTAELDEQISALSSRARLAAQQTAALTGYDKSVILANIASSLERHKSAIIAANAQDVEAAQAQGMSSALIDRLQVNDNTINGIINSINAVRALPDPIGVISDLKYMPSSIQVGKMRVPIGVVGVIYESRPNVTVDSAVLNIKAGNAAILRGGRDAAHSNALLLELLRTELQNYGVDPNCLQAPPSMEHDFIWRMLAQPANLDLVIPRGGRALIESVLEHSRVPVLKHLDGNCHVYVDAHADPYKASAIVINAKTRRYGVCNAMESLLIHADVVEQLFELIIEPLQLQGVELRGCPRTCRYHDSIVAASEDDYYSEYLAPILSIKIVNSADEAIEHINHYGSHHTDAIVTESYSNGRNFLRFVDSSSVLWNASTAFADGAEFGLGAEIGISTDKLHARGPVGLDGLTSEKFVVLGNGETRP